MARQGFFSQHWNDSHGRPAGGVTSGKGFVMSWQNGPLRVKSAGGESGSPPNGAFVEDVLDAVRDRIEFYQKSPFNCQENAEALHHIEEALRWLDKRTKDREARNVEGTHQL